MLAVHFPLNVDKKLIRIHFFVKMGVKACKKDFWGIQDLTLIVTLLPESFSPTP